MNRRQIVRITAGVCLGGSLRLLSKHTAEARNSPLAPSHELLQPSEGLLGSAQRLFYDATLPADRVSSISAGVGEFRTVEHAQAAMMLWAEQEAKPGDTAYIYSPLERVAVEPIGDESMGLVGWAKSTFHDGLYYVRAMIAVREGSLLFSFGSFTINSDSLHVLTSVARRTIGLERLEFAPVPDIGYETGELWNLLPRLEHLPQGMTWQSDFVPCRGVLASTSCDR